VCGKRHTDIGRLWSTLALYWRMLKEVDRFLFVYTISYVLMERLADQQQVMRITKALADPRRFRILQAIAGARESCCGELATRFPVTQATRSQHLKVLFSMRVSLTWGKVGML